MPTLHLDLGDRSYPIYIDAGVLTDPAHLRRHITGRQVLIVTNETVAPLYLATIQTALGGSFAVSVVVLPDGEEFKTLRVLERVFDTALADGHNRSTTVLALGGGVVGDMAGFAAASYLRGVAFVQVPTTLLAQVDSSVGGKTAVNHPLGKNMIGAFYQPRAVLIDTNVLATLPDREYAAGLAEVVKYGLICDADFYVWLQDRSAALRARDPETLALAIERSCAAKARIVAADEREGGVRALLNLGHTFGHAIESAQGYGKWLHGEAVSAGMVLAARFSQQRGWLSSSQVEELIGWLEGQALPVEPPRDMDLEAWLEPVRRDKKVIDGALRFVLLRTIGEACLESVSEAELTRFIAPFTSA